MVLKWGPSIGRRFLSLLDTLIVINCAVFAALAALLLCALPLYCLSQLLLQPVAVLYLEYYCIVTAIIVGFLIKLVTGVAMFQGRKSSADFEKKKARILKIKEPAWPVAARWVLVCWEIQVSVQGCPPCHDARFFQAPINARVVGSSARYAQCNALTHSYRSV